MSETRDDRWMVWSNRRGGWWKGSKHGYTLDFDEAGVFTYDEAKRITDRPITGLDGVPNSVMLRAPRGEVARPRTEEIVHAARALAESARTWEWGAVDWPALVQLVAGVDGLPFPRKPLPECPDCGHANYHCLINGCVSWMPHGASVLAPAGGLCGCRRRNDLIVPL